MNAPTLIVGLGGTGSKVVLRVSKMLTAEQRGSIGFAIFDTDVNDLRKIKDENPYVHTIQTSTRLSVGEYLDIDTHARDTWFPVSALLNSKQLTEGAGQVRAISRLAFETAIRAGKMEPLHEAIEELYKLEGEEYSQALRVIIVSSLAGGTGSGIILPVALYIRNYLATRYRQSGNITRGFFLLPEVFYGVIPGEAERNNLKSNAYATLKELDAFLMRGDSTLPEKFKDSVKMEFPIAGTDEFEEYNVRPYDFCFLFDAQNADGKTLNSFDKYLEHAANCIYSQSIGPMNKRSNSSEDNTIRKLVAERGRNRYAGAGSSILIYPYEDVKEYIALNWTENCVSRQWLRFDEEYKKQLKENAKRRNAGTFTVDIDRAQNYIQVVNSLDSQNDPFAKVITNECSVYDDKGIMRIGSKWDKYIEALHAFVAKASQQSSQKVTNKSTSLNDAMRNLADSNEWQSYYDFIKELVEYRSLVERQSEENASTIAYSLFRADDEEDITNTEPHQLEHYFTNYDGFMHPNSIRYFLYNVLVKLQDASFAGQKTLENLKKFFENFKTTVLGEDSADMSYEMLLRKKTSIIDKFSKRPSAEQDDLASKFSVYKKNVEDYAKTQLLEAVYEEGIQYVKDLIEAFEKFYDMLPSEVEKVQKNIGIIERKYNDTKGTAARYICATKTCLEKIRAEFPYTGGFNTVDGELSKAIYNRVREYAMNPRAKEDEQIGKNFFDHLFNNNIINYFREQVPPTVDMDIITAIEKEAEYEHGKHEPAEQELYIKQVFDESKVLAAPFIEKPLGEEKQPINACAYNDQLNPHDDSPRSRLIDAQLANFGGEEDKDIPKNTIFFYKSFYGLRANDLSKFAPAEYSDTYSRTEGEYFKAYFDLVSRIHPETHKSSAITPHINRWWHNASKMPDIDDANQKKLEYNVYAAVFWGLLNRYIERQYNGANSDPVYRLADELVDDNMDNVLVVSNGTPCDKLYEIVDALSIYPALVNKILEKRNKTIREEIDSKSKYDKALDGILKKNLDRFRLEEFEEDSADSKKGRGAYPVRSIFDLPILMKRSVPSAEYFEEKVLRIVDVSLTEVKNYIAALCDSGDVAIYLGKILVDQYEKYARFILEEQKYWKNITMDTLFNRTSNKLIIFMKEYGLKEDAEAIEKKYEELKK